MRHTQDFLAYSKTCTTTFYDRSQSRHQLCRLLSNGSRSFYSFGHTLASDVGRCSSTGHTRHAQQCAQCLTTSLYDHLGALDHVHHRVPEVLSFPLDRIPHALIFQSVECLLTISLVQSLLTGKLLVGFCRSFRLHTSEPVIRLVHHTRELL